MTTLKQRIVKLEAMIDINKPVIIFRPEPHEHNRIERQAEIVKLTASGE